MEVDWIVSNITYEVKQFLDKYLDSNGAKITNDSIETTLEDPEDTAKGKFKSTPTVLITRNDHADTQVIKALEEGFSNYNLASKDEDGLYKFILKDGINPNQGQQKFLVKFKDKK